jgi:hypothetical protein
MIRQRQEREGQRIKEYLKRTFEPYQQKKPGVRVC